MLQVFTWNILLSILHHTHLTEDAKIRKRYDRNYYSFVQNSIKGQMTYLKGGLEEAELV